MLAFATRLPTKRVSRPVQLPPQATRIFRWTAHSGPLGPETQTGVSLVQGTAGYWWGTFSWGVSCDCSIGRIKVVQDATNIRGYVVYLFDSNYHWQAVQDDGHFTFTPFDQNDTSYFMRRVTVLDNGSGTYEAWGDPIFGAREAINPANPGCNANDNTTSTLLHAAISDITQEGVNPGLLAASSIGYQSGVSVRAIPDANGFGRMYPYRLNDMTGKKVIYSASTDRYVCQTGTDPLFKTSEIILTVLDQ